MIERNAKVKVLNRDNGAVVYEIPELNGLSRYFGPGETKEIPIEELEKLSYIPGGLELIKNCLMIDNKEVVEQLVGPVEMEYYYTPEQVKDLMLTGSLDAFLDCLDFAPDGVKDLIKYYAVEIPLNDVAKREAILDKLGFDVDGAIRIKKETEVEEKPEASHRRVTTAAAPAPEKKERRTVIK